MLDRIRSGALWTLAISISFAMLALCYAEPAPAATNLTISWDAVTTDLNGVPYPAGTVVTYNVYGALQGQPLKLLTTVSTTTNVRSNVNPGTACYAITAVIATVESAQSTPLACAVVDPGQPVPTPSATPAAPTNVHITATTARNAPRPGRHRVMYAVAVPSHPIAPALI